jgi:UDP-N-acetylglucosamine 1-carboxyvinyltransferase
MSRIEVIGGEQLKGELKIQGSKNAALPIIAATILNKGITILKNCPKILDVNHMVNILERLGCIVTWDKNTLIVNSKNASITRVPDDSVCKMRSSVLFLGAILGRFHEVTIAYPGGCSIGKRPINYHLDAIKRMNVKQEFLGEDEDIIHCYSDKIIGSDIFFERSSVGATQNAILTAVLSEGITKIYNAAKEPEVTELCNYLVRAGAKIYGEGTSYIEVIGVKKLHDVVFTLSPDRIVAGTYMAAVAATQGNVIFHNAPSRHLEATITVLRKIGCHIDVDDDKIRIENHSRPKPINIITEPYPSFPTDMQSQLMSILCLADGVSIVVENIFESRFQNADELEKMGARVEVDEEGKIAVITGVKTLSGAQLYAHDLRGGAALIIAALAAKGTSVIYGTDYIERGYEDIGRDLNTLGAKIKYHCG